MSPVSRPVATPVIAATVEEKNEFNVEEFKQSASRSKRNSLMLLHNAEKKKAFQEALRSPVARGIQLEPLDQESKESGHPSLSRSISLYSLPDLSTQKKSRPSLTTTTPRPGPKTPKRKKKSSMVSSLSLRNSRKRSVTDFKQFFTRGSSQASLEVELEDETPIVKKRYFSCNLEEVMQYQRAIFGMEELKVPYFMMACASYLTMHFSEEEGLFRVSPALTSLEEAVADIERCDFVGKSFIPMASTDEKPKLNVHIYSGLIKKFLRDMAEPLLGLANYDRWISCIGAADEQRTALKALILELPTDHYNLLKFVFSLATDIAKKCHVNLMNSENLSRVIGPNILWNHEITDPSITSKHISLINQLAQFFITNYNFVFDEPEESTPVEPDTKDNIKVKEIPDVIEVVTLEESSIEEDDNVVGEIEATLESE